MVSIVLTYQNCLYTSNKSKIHLTPPTSASATLPVGATVIVVLTMPESVMEDHLPPATGNVVLSTTRLCLVSVMTSVLSMETAVQTIQRSVMEELEVREEDIKPTFIMTYAGSLSDQDLKVLSEMLIAEDTNNVGGKIELNLQCTTHNGNTQVISPL